MKFYVYSHINPGTKEPFYIGKGTGSRCHSSSGRNSAWKGYVAYLKKQGLTFGVSILHVCETSEEALEKEMQEVQRLVSEGRQVLNRACSVCVNEIIIDESVDCLTDPISAFIKMKRKSLKLTQEELADKAGIGLRAIRELERGKSSMQMNIVNQVLALFGCQLGPQKTKIGTILGP